MHMNAKNNILPSKNTSAFMGDLRDKNSFFSPFCSMNWTVYTLWIKQTLDAKGDWKNGIRTNVRMWVANFAWLLT